MSDLIERQAAIDDLHGRDPSQVWDTADVEVWINALPSVQPEVIRCKDCKWHKWHKGQSNSEWLPEWLPCIEIITPPDFYCKYAERRTDG